MEPISAALFAKPVAALAQRLLQPLIKKAEAELTGQSEVLLHRLFGSYTKYLENAAQRHSYFNSVVFKNEQRKLEEFYLPMTLINGKDQSKIRLEAYPADEIDRVKRTLIVDTAGMGKTTILKFLFLKCVSQQAAIPLFVELRKLSKKHTLLDFLLEQLSDVQGKCQPELFFRLLASGDFVFFLDGYDEIPDSERAEVTASIQQFIERTPGNRFIITSRDETGLAAFPSFQRYGVQPLEKQEAYTLLRKYSEGGPLAEALIAKLEQPENSAIHEFLSNPLLTSLLFKSFEYKHTIPLKRHIFYRQVYEALYETHDLTKEGGEFQRQKRSGLDIDRFEHILRTFGAITYKLGRSELTKDETIENIAKARTLASEPKVVPSHMLHDMTHAVPLLVLDGNYVRWSHRSIQEYFAAQYICNNTKGKQADILLNYFKSDDVAKHINLILLCADIDRNAFDQSIGKEIARSLLDNYTASFARVPDGLSGSELNERKSLVCGKALYLINTPPDILTPGSEHEIQMSVIKDLHQRMIAAAGLSAPEGASSTSIELAQPGVGQIRTKLDTFILNSKDRLGLPFIKNIVPQEIKPQGFTDSLGDVLKLDDDPQNPLNAPEQFAQVNALLFSSLDWRFDASAANDYLNALDAEEQAKSALAPW